MVEKLKKYVENGGHAVITSGFLKAEWGKGIEDLTSLKPTGRRVTGTRYQVNYLNIPDGAIHQSDQPIPLEVFQNKNNATWNTSRNDVLLHVNDFCTPLLTQDLYGKGMLNTLIAPDNFGDLYRIPGPIWSFIAKVFARGARLFLGAEPRVNLFRYDNGVFAVYNYRPYGAPLELTLLDEQAAGFVDLETGERFTQPHHVNPQPRRMGDAATCRPEPLERVFRLHIAPGEFKFYRLLTE